MFKGGEQATQCWQNELNTLVQVGEFNNTVQDRVGAWFLITLTVAYVGMFLNTAIIYDLSLVIKNPF